MMAENVQCTKLDCCVGGFPGPWYRVTLLPDGTLRYLCDDEAGAHSEILTRPSEEAWTKFYHACMSVGLGKWEKKYSNADVTDGASWACSVEIGNISYKGEGSNGFPPSGDPDPGLAFGGLCSAISQLVGELEFE